MPISKDIVQFVHVLGTTLKAKTKRVLAQIGSIEGEGLEEANNVEWIQHVGFASRPAKAVIGSKDETASAVVLRVGNREIAIGSFDVRGLPLYGSLAEGETCVYSAGDDGNAQARIILKKNGSINCYTRKGNTADGAGMLFQMDAENGAIRLINDLGYGLIIDEDGVRLTSGEAALTLGSDGAAKLIGTGQAQLDGASICLGSIAVPVVNSIVVGPCGFIGVSSSKAVCAIA